MTNPRRQVSPSVAEEIDREVKLVIDNAHQIALGILSHNRELLKELAKSLLDKEILEGEQLRSHLGQAQKTADTDRWLQTGELIFPHNTTLPTPNIVNNGKSLQC